MKFRILVEVDTPEILTQARIEDRVIRGIQNLFFMIDKLEVKILESNIKENKSEDE